LSKPLPLGFGAWLKPAALLSRLDPESVVASSRSRRRQGERIVGSFVALPSRIIRSAEYVNLSHAARSLLILVAAQYTGHNNGRLVATPKYLRTLGWLSNDSTTKCLKELVDGGLLVRTRLGACPNKAAWYAITWRSLDVRDGLDLDPKQFRQFVGTNFIAPPSGKGALKIVVPSSGAKKPTIAPLDGIDATLPVPAAGAVRPDFPPSPIPLGGDYLDLCHLQEVVCS
jgi:hypothetical protein